MWLWAPRFVGTVMKSARMWPKNLKKRFQRRAGTGFFMKKGTENISWICGRPIVRSSWRREWKRGIFPCPISVPAAIRNFCFPTGLPKERGEISALFSGFEKNKKKVNTRLKKLPELQGSGSFLHKDYSSLLLMRLMRSMIFSLLERTFSTETSWLMMSMILARYLLMFASI